MKPLLVSLTALLFGFCMIGLGQSDEEDDVYLEQIDKQKFVPLHQMNAQFFNKAIINQIGNQNQAFVTQMYSDISFGPNSVNILQNGSFNQATVDQIGSGNVLGLEQYGDNNIYSVLMNGNEIISEVQQNGVGNTSIQEFSGNNMRYIITQSGFNLHLHQIETDSRSVPYEVHQSGNGMRLMIINGPMPAVLPGNR